MAPKLYMTKPSPPVRAVLMVAKAIGLQLELIPIDLLKREHLEPKFSKINPQNTVPTLVDDDGFIIWDSHAIAVYLITKYAPHSSLLPKDVRQRAIVDQRLHFDTGTLFARMSKIARPILFQGKKTIDDEDKNAVIDAYEIVEKFLENKQWIVGDALTVADYNTISTVSSLNELVPIDYSRLPRLAKWMKKVEELPAYEANKDGLQVFRAIFKNLL